MKKEIILTLLTFIFLSIGAYFCYKKKMPDLDFVPEGIFLVQF